MERIAILFDIDDLGDSHYGLEAWRIFFTILDPIQMRGCTLFHGDTDHRIPGRRLPFCWTIAVDCETTGQVSYIKDSLSKSQAKGLMPVSARFAQGRVAVE
jgi:hypothetical protein